MENPLLYLPGQMPFIEVTQKKVKGKLIDGMCNRKISLSFTQINSYVFGGSSHIIIQEKLKSTVETDVITMWVERGYISLFSRNPSTYRVTFETTSDKFYHKRDIPDIIAKNIGAALACESYDTYVEIIAGKGINLDDAAKIKSIDDAARSIVESYVQEKIPPFFKHEIGYFLGTCALWRKDIQDSKLPINNEKK